MVKKILITGASGMLGSLMVQKLTEYETIGLNKNNLDITNIEDVEKIILNLKPDLIIHTAAHTNVEDAENNIDLSYKINVIGTYNLVKICQSKKIKFMFISSTGIYGKSKSTPYIESDKVIPTTVHHTTKHEAEKIVEKHLSDFVILRTGWLFGGKTTHTKNFVFNRYLEGKKSDIIFANPHQFGVPTSIIDLIEQIKVILKNDLIGVYNCVNKGYASRSEYIQEIFKNFNLDTQVLPIEGTFERRADVSNNEMANNYYLELMNLNVMKDWRESLAIYIDQLRIELGE